jgi:uncharacterized protein YqjF (DUF2071 family)
MSPTPHQRLSLRDHPGQPFVMHQRWEQLLFLHWTFDPALIQATLPPGLPVDTFGGHAWVAIVPFLMRGIRPRFLPSVSRVSDFLELNLRTYVHDDKDRAGVWFYSLDCNQGLAVWTARKFFHLPYQPAEMSVTPDEHGGILYASRRKSDKHTSHFQYRLQEHPQEAQPGSLEFFLAERYLLFSKTPRGLKMGRVHHRPYLLAGATVQKWDTRLFALAGLPEPQRPPDHIVGSAGVQVRVFPLQAMI